MRKYMYLYVLLATAIIVGFILSASFVKLPVRQKTDMLAVNEIVKSIEQSWSDPQKLHGKSFLYRVSVIDNSGQLVWAIDRNVADNLQQAVQLGYAVMDITVGGNIVGKAFIETNPGDFEGLVNRRFTTLVIISFLILCTMSFLFLLTIHMVVVKPFEKLEGFANKISTGRFDEPLTVDRNNIFGLFTQSFDVMRASLLEARHKQSEAERAKKELIASLSHDIKTPVTSIKLIAELLLAVNPEPMVCEKLKTIESKAEQINRLMNDMMHSTLEELGELKVNLTSESSQMIRELFKDTDHYERVRIGNVPQCMVDLDATRMEQIIGNIITNSYKYAGTDIDVACMVDGGFLRIEVNDYGAGVEPVEIELICTKFYRGENAKSSQQDGEGMGLYIAKLLMDKMGGGLEVYNRADGFSVRLMLRLSK